MLDGVVSDLLMRYLGRYVQNLDREQLNISVWKGDVSLRSLKMKRGALDALDLPVTVIHGYLGSLLLKIPWSRLQSEPVIAEIDDVFVVLQPKKATEWEEEREKERMIMSRKAELESFEALNGKKQSKQESSQEQKDNESSDGFISQLTETIINNLQIVIRNVHVRYEDVVTDPENPFVVGFTLEEISARSTDENWAYTFMKNAQDIVFKLVKLEKFSLYLNNEYSSDLFSEGDFTEDAIQKEMKKQIHNTSHRYILNPITGNLKLKMRKKRAHIDLDSPKFDAAINFDEVAVNCSDQQYQSIVNVFSYMLNYKKFEKFRKFRPNKRPSIDPRAWWKFAANSVIESSREKNSRNIWKNLYRCTKYKRRYITLYKRFRKVPWMDALDDSSKKELDQIEIELPLDSLITFRKIAAREIEIEANQHKEWKERTDAARGWFSWGAPQEEQPEFSLTQEQQKELYEALHDEEDDIQDEQSPQELIQNYTKLRVQFQLEKGSLLLKDTIQDIVSLQFSDFISHVDFRTDSLKSELTLGSFHVIDKYSLGSCFPKITSSKSSTANKLLRVQFCQNDSEAVDYKLGIDLAPMDIVINFGLLKRITSFLIVPDMINLEILEDAAKEQLASITQKAQQQLSEVISNRSVVDVALDIDAPNVFIPQNVLNEDTDFVLLELGKFTMSTNDETLRRKKRLETEKVTQDDFYDKFQIHMSDTQVLLGAYNEAWASLKFQEQHHLQLLHKFSADVLLGISIASMNENLPQTTIRGNVDAIKLHLTPTKFEKLMRIANLGLQFMANPTGRTSKPTNSDYLHVYRHHMNKDEITGHSNESIINSQPDEESFKFTWCELRLNKILMFDDQASAFTKEVIELNSLVNVKELNDRTILLDLPQEDGTTIRFWFLHPNESCKLWVSQIQSAKSVISSEHEITEKEDGKENQEGSATQKILDAQLSLETVSIMISRELENQEKPLVELSWTGLNVNMAYRNYDIRFGMTLQSVILKDLAEKCKYRNIITCEESQDLGDIVYMITSPGSPDYIPDAFSSLDMKFSKTKIMLNRVTLGNVVTFIYDILEAMNRLQSLKLVHSAYERKNVNIEEEKPIIKSNTKLAGAHILMLDASDNIWSESEMSETNIDIVTNISVTSISGELGNVVVRDLEVEDTKYKEILGLQSKGDSLIHFNYVLKSLPPCPTPRFSSFVDVDLNSVRIVYLRRFFSKFSSYWTQGPLMNAIRAGSQRAKQNTEDLSIPGHLYSDMLKMDISMNKPVIIIPKAYNQDEYLYGDLGQVSITNKLNNFESLWIEKYNISLREMAVASVHQGSMRSAVEDMFLKIKIHFVLVNDDEQRPETFIEYDFHDVNINMNYNQYQLLYGISDNNFSNVFVEEHEIYPTVDEESLSSSSTEKDRKEAYRIPSRVTYQNKFLFNRLNLTILRRDGMDFQGETDPLVRFDLHHLTVDTFSFQNEKYQVLANFHHAELTDLRKEVKTKFKDLISALAQHQTGGNDEPCFTLRYQSHPNGDQILGIEFKDPTISIVPEVSNEIQEFFSPIRENQNNDSETQDLQNVSGARSDLEVNEDISLGEDLVLSPNRRMIVHSDVVIDGQGNNIIFACSTHEGIPVLLLLDGASITFKNVVIIHSDNLESLIAPPDADLFISRENYAIERSDPYYIASISQQLYNNNDKVENSRFKLSMTFGKPKFIFFESPEFESSHVLVLEAGVAASYLSAPHVEKGHFSLQSTTLYSSSFPLPSKIGARILEPVDINVSLNGVSLQPPSGPKRMYRDFEMELGNVTTRVSYNDILLLMSIYSVFQEPSSKQEKNTELIEFDSESEYEDAVESISNQSNKPIVNPIYKLSFNSKDWSVLLVDDIRGYDIPLIDFHLRRLGLNAKMQGSQLAAKMNFEMNADYYNLKIAEWEPILERWIANTKYARIDTDSLDYPTKQELYVDSPTPLNINVSNTIINTILTTSRLWNEGFKKKETASKKFYPYTIRNQTGSKIMFWTSNQEMGYEIAHQTELAFDFENKSSRSMWNRDSKVIIKFTNCLAPHPIHIPVNKVGVTNYNLQDEDGNVHHVLKAEIRLSEGKKIITIRSCMKIENKTDLTLLCGAQLEDEHKLIATLAPGDTVGVPFTLLDSGKLALKPKQGSHSWSILRKIKDLMTSAAKTTVHCKSKQEYMSDWTFVLKTTRSKNKSSDDIYSKDYCTEIWPPFAVENLLGCSAFYTVIAKKPQKEQEVIFVGKLERGEINYMYSRCIPKSRLMIQVVPYPFECWRRPQPVTVYIPQEPIPPPILHVEDEQGHKLQLRTMITSFGSAYRTVYVYAPFWVVNHTRLNLSIQSCTTGPYKLAAGQNQGYMAENEPLMLSGTDREDTPNRARFKIRDSDYSEPFTIDSAGNVGSMSIISGEKQYEIGVGISIAPGKFKYTKIITLSARYIILNKSEYRLFIKQHNTTASSGTTVEAGNQSSFFWNDYRQPKLVSIRIEHPHYNWSHEFKVDALGEYCIKLTNNHNTSNPMLMRVQIVEESTSVFIVVDEQGDVPPYRIVNNCNHPVEIAQDEVRNWWTLEAKSSASYAFDNINLSHYMLIRFQSNAVCKMNIDQVSSVKKFLPFRQNANSDVPKVAYLSVEAEGPTRVLKISETPKTQQDKQKEVFQQEIECNFAGIGVSLIDGTPLEIAYIFLQDIEIFFSVSNLSMNTELKLQKLQIDSCLLDTEYPVLLTPDTSENQSNRPYLHISVVRSLEYKTVDFYRYFSILMLEANLSFDRLLVDSLFDFFNSLDFVNQSDEEATQQMLSAVDAPNTEPTETKRMYFEVFHLNPVKINTTFSLHSARGSKSLQIVLNSLGVAFTNVDKAPLRFDTLYLENLFQTPATLKDRVYKHYKRQAIREFFTVVGSIDVLGNPVGLFSDITTGVKIFFYEPAQGFTNGPRDFTKGMVKGTKGLLSNVAHGTSNATTKITGSISKGLGMLSLDKEYITERQRAQRVRPKDVGEGFSGGADAFTHGIWDGMTGIFRKPLEGSQKEGVGGFMKGVGKGLLGVPVKPMVGVLEFATKTTEGIKNTFDAHVDRIRMPRVFSESGAIIPYNTLSTRGHHLLNGILANSWDNETDQDVQQYVLHVRINQDQWLFLTDKQIIITDLEFMPQQAIKLKYITKVELGPNSIIYLTSHIWDSIRQTTSTRHSQIRCKLLPSDALRGLIAKLRSTQREYEQKG
eukprot:gb/GECH01013539.1/.p1 GENE.gb/GECH01013539.1/~~gb/GECH01013539.1/.p1  ORF type:complete len:3191 (+),score=691.51 gb/GECH01013539.1/:1-9573(+)